MTSEMPDASAAHVPRSVVHNPFFDWGSDRYPDVPLNESVIYEVHVKGFTARHPDIPEAQRGTYAGLAHPAALDYLTNLGVTAVELLPVHQFVHDSQLVARGLRNYWGYNSIGFLAPHNAYAAAGQGGEQARPVPRGGRVVGFLRPDSAGSRRIPGQAHRGAVGCRPGRLPGRQLPAAVVGMERAVPRYRP